jgi:L-gulono-1,4-lactone dehydrogenase
VAMGASTIRNWDGTQRWRPEAIHHPVDDEEVVALVKRAAERGRRLKPVGAALSWSDAIDIPAEAMRFDRMTAIDVDVEGKRVRVQAGARLKDVNEALAQHGLALDNFGSIVTQTAGGYLGTGSHGTGGRTPILASMVTHMRLVDGTGLVHELDAAREPDVFAAARVHLGCLGVVTEVTFRCVEAYQLEERLQLIAFDTLLADLDRIVADNDYVKLWWLAYTDKIQVYTFNRTERARTRTSFTGWMDGTGLSGALFTGLMALSRALPAVTPPMNRAAQALHFRPHERVDRSDKVIRYAGSIPKHQETEYAIHRERAPAALHQVRAMVRAARYRVNFPFEVRFVAPDDIPMSPTSGRDSCYLGAYVGSRKWARPYFADFEALMLDYDGRPHWGKTFSRTGAELRRLYPGYDAFDALRRRLDPHGMFRNSFVDRVFPTAREGAEARS